MRFSLRVIRTRRTDSDRNTLLHEEVDSEGYYSLSFIFLKYIAKLTYLLMKGINPKGDNKMKMTVKEIVRVTLITILAMGLIFVENEIYMNVDFYMTEFESVLLIILTVLASASCINCIDRKLTEKIERNRVRAHFLSVEEVYD